MNNIEISFSTAVERFFNDYLVKERGLSHNTLRSYRDTFLLILDFYKEKKQLNAEQIHTTDINKKNILAFLDWLEESKKATSSTRNQRCAALFSIARFMMYNDLTHLEQWNNLLTIRMKKTETGKLDYLPIDGIKLILEQIDTSTVKGLRDLCIISLLYNSGVRVQELIDLTPSSFNFLKPYYVVVRGKGSKTRMVPLDEPIIKLVGKYIKEYNINTPNHTHHPLFFNSRKEKLTNPGVAYIISKYVDMAKKVNPTLIKCKVSPHTFRHSRAMHLLQAGVKLIYIRDILGHVSIQTTQIYARADSKDVRTALEQAYENIGLASPMAKSWEEDSDLRKKLKSFC